MSNSCTIYVLQDQRTKPHRNIYIGISKNIDLWHQSTEIDDTRKGKYVREIIASGESVSMRVMFGDLSEEEARSMHPDIVSSLGTIENGGPLLNE